MMKLFKCYNIYIYQYYKYVYLAKSLNVYLTCISSRYIKLRNIFEKGVWTHLKMRMMDGWWLGWSACPWAWCSWVWMKIQSVLGWNTWRLRENRECEGKLREYRLLSWVWGEKSFHPKASIYTRGDTHVSPSYVLYSLL